MTFHVASNGSRSLIDCAIMSYVRSVHLVHSWIMHHWAGRATVQQTKTACLLHFSPRKYAVTTGVAAIQRLEQKQPTDLSNPPHLLISTAILFKDDWGRIAQITK